MTPRRSSRPAPRPHPTRVPIELAGERASSPEVRGQRSERAYGPLLNHTTHVIRTFGYAPNFRCLFLHPVAFRLSFAQPCCQMLNSRLSLLKACSPRRAASRERWAKKPARELRTFTRAGAFGVRSNSRGPTNSHPHDPTWQTVEKLPERILSTDFADFTDFHRTARQSVSQKSVFICEICGLFQQPSRASVPKCSAAIESRSRSFSESPNIF